MIKDIVDLNSMVIEANDVMISERRNHNVVIIIISGKSLH